MTSWQNNRAARDARIAAGAGLARGKVVEAHDVTRLLEAVIRPGDRVCLEGDNQKQADLLSSALLAVDLSKVNDLHMVQSGVVLPEHLDLFDRGVAKRLDYAYSGPQSARIARFNDLAARQPGAGLDAGVTRFAVALPSRHRAVAGFSVHGHQHGGLS